MSNWSFAKKKDGSVHQIANWVDDKTVRLRYHGTPTKISKLKKATEKEYKDYINQQAQ